MAYQKESLNLEMKEVVFVKPSNPISSSILSLSDFDHRTDCNGMGQSIFVYQSSNINSPNNNKVDPFFVIKEALSKALLYYYPLAGRLVENGDGKLNIHLEPNHGVPLVEAIANCHLSSLQYLDGNDVEIAKKLAFDLPLQDKNGHQYPLVMKVTKFLCGGFTIGLGISHVVCDGVGVAQFYKAMSEVASGKSEPSIKPVWERESVLVGSINKEPFQDSMGIDTAAISPYLPTSDLVHGCIKVNGEVIRRLRMSLINECTNDNTKKENITALDSLMAYIWRSRARALNQSYDGKTRLSIMTGVRKFFVDPPFPKGYYGNAVVDVYVVLTVKELNEKPLLEIAKLINMSKKDGSNSDYIKKSLNTIYPSLDDFNHESGAVVSLTDWRHLGYLEMGDLAGNKLVNVVPAPCNLFGMVDLIIFTPPSKLDSSMKEGVRIFTSLPSAAMLKFTEEINTLNNIMDPLTTQPNWWPSAKL